MACGLTAAALLTTSACGLFGSGSSKSSAGGKGAGPAAATTSSSPQATPQSVAQAFLTAWSGGDYAGAAALTDNAKDATSRLGAVMGALAPKKLTLALGEQENVPAAGGSTGSTPSATSSSSGAASSPASPSGSAAAPTARYSFTVSADFGNNLVWTYKSAVDLVQGPDGSPLVHWASAVVNPQLTGAQLLKAVPPPQSVVGADGNPIDTTRHPTLAAAVKALSTHVPANTTPTQLTVEFVDANTGSQIPQSKSWVLSNPGTTTTTTTVKTSIDPKVQSAIEAALSKYPQSGMVAIQPSTGNILGMASNDSTFPALAYRAARAPGSTFKVITTALALQKGLSVSTGVNCSPNVTVEGQVINNDSSLRNGLPAGATLKDGFLQSCNTAFVHLALDGKLGSDYTALSNEAKNYFGMDQKWDLGLGPATYGTGGDQQVPPATGLGDFAREAFGQSGITMSPLTMASVAATVANGSFKQPVLVPGTQSPATTQPLPSGVDAQLTTLMQGVINSSEGTAAGVFPTGLGLAGKTGSAEQAESAKPGGKTDSWMIVFDKRHNIAFGALVVDGGFGRDAAGPAINKVLSSLGYE
jgi:hypothetical protein